MKCPPHILLLLLAALFCPIGKLPAAGSYDYLYDFNSERTLGAAGSNQRRLSVPRKNGVELPVIKAVLCNYPGAGASGNAGSPHASFARWAYDNGIVFYSVGYPGASPSETISDLATFATLNYVNNAALTYAPLIVQGGSYGCSTTMSVASAYPERTIALYGYHKGSASPPDFPRDVPAHISFGEMDSSYSDYNTNYHWQYLASWEAQGGAPRCFQFDRESAHTEIVDRPSHLQLFVESMMSVRYPYQQGVSGKDPSVGAVTLTTVNLANGWRGEHLFSPSNPTAAAVWNGIPYAERAKDFDSPNLAIAPVASFDRENAHMHSWFPDARLAAAWRSRAGLGARQMRMRFPSLPSSDAQDNTIRTATFNTDQTLACELDAGLFTSASRVEFYDGTSQVGQDSAEPFTHTYSWLPGDEGLRVLFAVAINDQTGERRVSSCRIVRVTPKAVAANTAPTISKIPVQTVPVGTTSLQIPFTIGDAETAPSSLGLLYVKESYRVDSDPHNETLVIAHTATFSGSGAERMLNLTFTDTAKTGVIWAVVQVHDGDLQANSYIRINVVPTSEQPPVFVPWRYLNSTYGTLGEVAFNGGWSKELSFRVFDPDTAPEDLIVTATTNNQSSIPDSNIIIGGYGEYRTLRVKATGTAYTTVTITVSDGTNSATSQWKPTPVAATNTAPVLNKIPDQSTYVGEPAFVMARPFDVFTTSLPINGFTALSVTAVSDNQLLLPNANITVIPAGHERAILCQPTAGQTGTANVTVTATDEGGLTKSSSFTLAVGAAVTPVILTAPTPVAVPSGGETILSVNAIGGEPKTYQWYRGQSGDTSSPVEGASSASLILSGLTASENYWVRVTNPAGTVDTPAAEVTVISAPTIISHPGSVQIYSGTTATFSVIATGEQLTYQWYEGERGVTASPVNGATAASFTTPALSSMKKYWVRVANPVGAENSYSATASIKTRSWVAYHDTNTTIDGNAPNVTTASVAATPGANTSLLNSQTGAATGVTLNALLTGTKSAKTNGTTAPAVGTDAYNAFNGIISFTGNHSEQLGGNATTSNVLFTFSGLDPDARYSVAFYAARNAFTTPNRYTISGADAFLEGHSFGVGDAGDSDAATADVASGAGSTTNGYLVRWIDIAPGADGTFAVEVRTHTGTSFAMIPQAVMLEAFTNTPPAAEIQSQPQGSSIPFNAGASLSVAATGDGLSYQWYAGSVGDTSSPVPGGTSASLISPALTSDTSFWVRITNGGGAVDSTATWITVAPELPVIQTDSIAAGTSGDAFSVTLSAWGGSGALTWSVASGQLPPGLSLDANTGVISGIPPMAGTAPVVLRVTDALGRSVETVFSIEIGKVEWSAYHDTITTPDGNSPGVSYGNTANANSNTFLKNFATGEDLAPLLSITSTIGTNGGYKAGATPAPNITIGPDAAAIFGGIISLGTRNEVPFIWDTGVNIWDLGTTGQAIVRLYRLDPSKCYDLAIFAARPLYDSRTQFAISLVSHADPVHSAGSLACSTDGSTVVFQTGAGSIEAGRVVRWTNIVPTEPQPGEPDKRYFEVTITPQQAGAYPAELPQAFRLRQIGSVQEFTALPAITDHPTGSTVNVGQNTSLSVTALGSGLSFQWYAGASGVTSNPVPGATSSSFTPPTLNTTATYWVRVTNSGGSMDSVAATVTVNGPAQTPLEIWTANQGLTGPDAEALAAPHGDGIPNFVKFALGMPGNAPASPEDLPTAALAGTTLIFTFHRATDAVRYVVESSTTLAPDSWTVEHAIEKNTVPDSVGADISVEIPMGSASRKFVRLRITE